MPARFVATACRRWSRSCFPSTTPPAPAPAATAWACKQFFDPRAHHHQRLTVAGRPVRCADGIATTPTTSRSFNSLGTALRASTSRPPGRTCRRRSARSLLDGSGEDVDRVSADAGQRPARAKQAPALGRLHAEHGAALSRDRVARACARSSRSTWATTPAPNAAAPG